MSKDIVSKCRHNLSILSQTFGSGGQDLILVEKCQKLEELFSQKVQILDQMEFETDKNCIEHGRVAIEMLEELNEIMGYSQIEANIQVRCL